MEQISLEVEADVGENPEYSAISSTTTAKQTFDNSDETKAEKKRETEDQGDVTEDNNP